MALTKRDADTALMPPPPAPKRQRRPPKVLDEDVYSDALSHIIARDFFPGLLETEAQQEYMEALHSKDNDWIREAGRKLTQVMTPGPDGRRRMGRGTSVTPRRDTTMGETPRRYAGETPGYTLRTPGHHDDDFAPEEQPEPDVDVNMSLGAFQAKYTSEDNESFNALLDKQNAKHAANYAFLYHGNKIPSARQIAHRAREQKRLESGASTSTALVTTNAAGDTRRAVSGNGPSQDWDARPASLDSFPSREGPRNHFMFDPDGVEDSTTTTTTPAPPDGHAATRPPKSVHYAGTRFPTASAAASAAPPASPSVSAIDAAIARRPRATDSEPGYTGAETPRVNGYAFVDAEPPPSERGVPVTDAEADAAERDAAMKFLPQADESGPNPFTIHARSKREALHHQLVEKADAGRRTGGGGRLETLRQLGVTPGRTPTPTFASAATVKRGGMTPAARMLAARIGQTPQRDGRGFGAAGKVDWTPTPRPKRAG